MEPLMFNASDFIVENAAGEGVPQLHSHLSPGAEVTFKVGSKVDGHLRALEVRMGSASPLFLFGSSQRPQKWRRALLGFVEGVVLLSAWGICAISIAKQGVWLCRVSCAA